MSDRELVKRMADQLNISPEELIEAVVIVFCDKATNQDAIVEQQVARYHGTQFGPIADYIYTYCVERLRPLQSEDCAA